MKENLFEAQYNITKKSKLKRFYESNKTIIYLIISILIISIISISFYLQSVEKKRIILNIFAKHCEFFLILREKNQYVIFCKKNYSI